MLASSEDEESEEECEIGYEQLDIVSETVNDTTVDSDEKKQREGYVLLTQEEDSRQGETTATSVEQERGDTPEEPTTNANQPAPMADSELDCIAILHCRDRSLFIVFFQSMLMLSRMQWQGLFSRLPQYLAGLKTFLSLFGNKNFYKVFEHKLNFDQASYNDLF